MKISTLLTMVTLSASCFAAPAHTAYESPATGNTDGSAAAALAANAAPVAPAAPDVTAISNSKTQHWQFIALPKSNHPERGFVAKNEHLQT